MVSILQIILILTPSACLCYIWYPDAKMWLVSYISNLTECGSFLMSILVRQIIIFFTESIYSHFSWAASSNWIQYTHDNCFDFSLYHSPQKLSGWQIPSFHFLISFFFFYFTLKQLKEISIKDQLKQIWKNNL